MSKFFVESKPANTNIWRCCKAFKTLNSAIEYAQNELKPCDKDIQIRNNKGDLKAAYTADLIAYWARAKKISKLVIDKPRNWEPYYNALKLEHIKHAEALKNANMYTNNII